VAKNKKGGPVIIRFIIKLFQFLVFLIIQIPLIPIAIIGIIPMLYNEMNIAGVIISIV
jgi:hypothetical protein